MYKLQVVHKNKGQAHWRHWSKNNYGTFKRAPYGRYRYLHKYIGTIKTASHCRWTVLESSPALLINYLITTTWSHYLLHMKPHLYYPHSCTIVIVTVCVHIYIAISPCTIYNHYRGEYGWPDYLIRCVPQRRDTSTHKKTWLKTITEGLERLEWYYVTVIGLSFTSDPNRAK